MTKPKKVFLSIVVAGCAFGPVASAQAVSSTPIPPLPTGPAPTSPGTTIGVPLPGDPTAGAGHCVGALYDAYAKRFGDGTDDWPGSVQNQFDEDLTTLCGDLMGD